MSDVDEKLLEAIHLYIAHHSLALRMKVAEGRLQKEKLLAEMDPAFHDTINKQFNTLVKQILSRSIAEGLDANPQEVYEILEHLNVKEFLKH